MGIKQAVRNWLFPGQEVYSNHLREQMRSELDAIQTQARHTALQISEHEREVLLAARSAKETIQQRASKPLWRRYSAHHAGPEFGRMAALASTSSRPVKPILVNLGAGIGIALRKPAVWKNGFGSYTILQHLDARLHCKLPVIDFGKTPEEAYSNMLSQLAQIALNEGWTITVPEN